MKLAQDFCNWLSDKFDIPVSLKPEGPDFLILKEKFWTEYMEHFEAESHKVLDFYKQRGPYSEEEKARAHYREH